MSPTVRDLLTRCLARLDFEMCEGTPIGGPDYELAADIWRALNAREVQS